MQSIDIKNRFMYNPESIQFYGVLMSIDQFGFFDPTAGIGLSADLKPRVQYEINRIDVYLTHFNNPVAPAAVAYPKWEQFSFNSVLQANLSSGGKIYKPLFNELMFFTPDGISATLAFTEPFIFRTDETQATTNQMSIKFSDNGSIFTTLSGITVPPPAGEAIELWGMVSFTGVSYDFDTAERINKMRIP